MGPIDTHTATDAVAVARAALCEAGRPDIAERVESNGGGWPSVIHGTIDREVIVRAFWLAHVAGGHHDATIGPDWTGESGINCEECWRQQRQERSMITIMDPDA